MSEGRPYFGPRRERRRRLAAQLVNVGIELLEESGAAIGGAEVTIPRALARLNEARSPSDQIAPGSVYDRLWARPEDFGFDVSVAAIHATLGVAVEELHVELVETVREMAEQRSEEAIEAELRNLIRVGARLAAEKMADSSRDLLRLAVLGSAATVSRSAADELVAIHQALETLLERVNDLWRDLFQELMPRYGLRPDPIVFGEGDQGVECALRTVTELVNSLGRSIWMRWSNSAEDAVVETTLPSGEGGIDEIWENLGIGVFLIVRGAFVPVVGAAGQ